MTAVSFDKTWHNCSLSVLVMGHTLAHSGGCRDSVNGKEDLKTVYMQVEIRDVKNRSLILRSYLYYSHEQEDTTFLYMVESSKSCYNR